MSRDVEMYAENAIRWARGMQGNPGYATRCLAFVEDAIERSNGLEMFGGDDAAESARLYGAAASTGEPPVGALVFWSGVGELFGVRRDWGHVGLSLGAGDVIHAWDAVRVDHFRALPSLHPAPGWEPLVYLGWVPLSRALEGSRPREWPDDDTAATAARMQGERFDVGDSTPSTASDTDGTLTA